MPLTLEERVRRVFKAEKKRESMSRMHGGPHSGITVKQAAYRRTAAILGLPIGQVKEIVKARAE
ncbi:hypothetical protein [Leifsonia sp. Leaf264]|uniref:hypothetical protein n=1 Tax=Leifsonia sp. Leaf264 TaxID=1736314 RepID=UPI000ADF6A25|nr:hypothetical protein [Leifsonia sp. Leaf264]